MAGITGARPLRILHMHSTFNLGGKEARAVQLMNHFGAQASHVVLSAQPDALGAALAIDPSIKVRIMPADAPPLWGKPSIARYRRFANYFRQFDLLLSYNWGAMDGVMAHCLFSHVQRLPALIHHEDGFNEDERVRRMKKRDWFRMVALARASALVVPSQTLEDIALHGWRQPRGRVQRIPNGIDTDRYLGRPQRGTIPGFTRRAGEVVVGTLAGLRPIKNLRLLVRAVAKAGENIRLVIVGEGPERAAIEAEAAKAGLGDRLLMPGFLPDPARYVGLFDIFALSSDSEQFPISLIEAMAAGCAVAATDVGDVANMVTAQNRPYIVKAGDLAALAGALSTLSGDADLRIALGEANRIKAGAEYNEAKMLARYRRLYGQAARRADFYAT